MICVVADENIAALSSYFGRHDEVRLIAGEGRSLSALIQKRKPDAVLVRSVTPINADTLNANARFVATATLGVDHVDTQFLQERGVHFVSAQGTSKHSVAQYALSATLALSPNKKPKSLGVIGLGNIGSTLAVYARALGIGVRGYDPFLPPSDLNNADFATALGCEAISVHTPLTTSGAHPTYRLIDRDALEAMPKGALLINSARGKVVDNAALLLKLKAGSIKAALDVFESEPFVARELLDSLAIATPHIAGYTQDAKIRGTDAVYRAFCRFFGLAPLATMDEILPKNPYRWSAILPALQQGKASPYDILADDRRTRSVADGKGVSPERFDALRKNYPLRREWIFDAPL